MNYFSKSFLIGLGLVSAVALAAAGDRFINNPNQDKDIIIQVNDGGVTKEVIKAEGSTGKVIIGTISDATVKAGGTNTDLNLEAVGSGGAVVFKTQTVEIGRGNQNGMWTLGISGGTQRHQVNGRVKTTRDVTVGGADSIGTFAGIYQASVSPASATTCTTQCANSDGTNGFGTSSGTCLVGWVGSTLATCGDATNAVKHCLCAGLD